MSKMVIEKYGENKAHYFSTEKDKPLFVIHALSPEEMRIIMSALNDYEKKVKRNTAIVDLTNSFTNQFSSYPEFTVELD